MTYGMLIDQKKCVGCNACSVACKEAHGTPPGMRRSHVEREIEGTFPDVRRNIVPMLCMHCENPPCVEACAVEGATYKRDDGIVTVDEETCIGCKSCMEACPYDVRRLIENEPEYYLELPIGDPAAKSHKGGTVEKCDFCAGRIDRGEKPACMELCPGRARYWGDLDDPESEVSQFLSGRNATVLLEEEGTSPSVYYVS